MSDVALGALVGVASMRIDAACDEYLRARGVHGQPAPIVALMDIPFEEDETFDEWRRAVNDLEMT